MLRADGRERGSQGGPKAPHSGTSRALDNSGGSAASRRAIGCHVLGRPA